MVDYHFWSQVLSLILLFLSGYWGVKLRRIKKTLGDVVKALEDTERALDDNKISNEEIKSLISDWRRVLNDI